MQRIENINDLILQLRSAKLEKNKIVEYIQKKTNNTIQIRIDQSKYNRVLLTTKRNCFDSTWELHSQCNGIVLQYPNWNVLSVPPRMFVPKRSIKYAIDNIEKYDIYPVLDGTIATFYYLDKWRMSTTNGFDVSNYKWMGPSTYIQAFNYVVSNYYPHFSFDKLDINKCYSIGFRFKDFHPFKYDSCYAWSISSCDLQSMNITYNEDINISLMTDYMTKLSTVPIRTLLNENEYAYGVFYNKIKNNVTDNLPHYGYALRAKSEYNHCTADILLESTLFSVIRKLMYNVPKNNKDDFINENNRAHYMALRAYLSADKEIFSDLFDASIFKFFDTKISKLIANITNKSTDDPLACTMRNKLCKDICISTITGINVIKDFLIDVKYLNIYSRYMLKNDNQRISLTLGEYIPKKYK